MAPTNDVFIEHACRDGAQGQTAPTPEPLLSLAEFVDALRAEFPEARVAYERTIDTTSRQTRCHTAAMRVYECVFEVTYLLLPSDSSERWVASGAGGVATSSPSGLRPLLALCARERAEGVHVEAGELTARAKMFSAAARYFEPAAPAPAATLSFASLDAAVEIFKKEVRGVASGQPGAVYAASMAMRLVFSEMKEDCEVALEARRAAFSPVMKELAEAVAAFLKSPPVDPPTPPPVEVDAPGVELGSIKPMSISQFSEVDAELVAQGFEPGHRVRREVYGHDHAWFWTRGRVKLYCDGDLENWCVYLDGREIVNSGPSSSRWVGTLANARATFYADAALFNVSV